MAQLSDLDELILRCRNQKAKAYIGEAVASYRAGAIRATIVSTWIAVCFDIIEKLHELTISGDKEAEKIVEDLDKIRKTEDMTRALKFEREILIIARDKFELLSPLECIDLERLQTDRNRCAHPSLISEDQVYMPPAELARTHLYNAVTSLLQYPPVQGKYALDRLVKELDSEYFPIDKDKAVFALSSGPLKNPRDSLARNFALVILKRLLTEEMDVKPQLRYVAALLAFAQMHPRIYSALLQEKLSPLMRQVVDGHLDRAIQFIRYVPDVWQYTHEDIMLRLNHFIEALPFQFLDLLEFALEFNPLKQEALRRVQRLSRDEATAANIAFFTIPEKVIDRMIDYLLNSASFDQANDMSKKIASSAIDLNSNHILRIIRNVQKNSQVAGCFELRSLMYFLRQRKKISDDEFNRELVNSGMSQFTSATIQ